MASRISLVCLAALGCGTRQNGGPSPDAAVPTIDAQPGGERSASGDGAAVIPSQDAENALSVQVTPGTGGVDYVNGLFATATICVPGTDECQTIDHLLVDTGSAGVRILESVLGLRLPSHTNPAGAALAECAPFLDSTAWGPLRTADLRLGKNRTASIPVQLIGDSVLRMPNTCIGIPILEAAALGANGVLGVGLFREDCGVACTEPASSPLNPGFYYVCPAPGSCEITSVAESYQLRHPVLSFSEDNNGVVLELPDVPATGSPSAQGILLFGIGTRDNNSLGAAVALAVDELGTVGSTYSVTGTNHRAFFDTGSNANYFLNTFRTKIPTCARPISAYYCPTDQMTVDAILSGSNGSSLSVSLPVANAKSLFGQLDYCAYGNLAGPMPGYSTDATTPAFIFGLPFHFGRRVFLAIEGQPTPGGSGPFFAM